MIDTPTLAPAAGDQAVLARRYVGSLYALAEKEGAIDAVASDMRGLKHLWDQSSEWRFIASDPRLGNEEVVKATKDVAQISGLTKLTTHFLLVAAQNRRLSLLPSFIEGFLLEVSLRRGEHRVDVRIARPLSSFQREALTTALTAALGGKVHMNVIEDASILGGLTVKIGSEFIDASVKTKLDHLERTLKGAA